MIDRRQFLQHAAAASFAASSPAFSSTGVLPAGSVRRVAVIGAGIVGSSIACHLSERGCEVLLIEKDRPASQASGNSFAWINASWFDSPRSYYELRSHSLNEYHRLGQRIGLDTCWGGSLEWYHTKEDVQEVANGIGRIQAYGAPAWMIDSNRVAQLEPALHLRGAFDSAWCSRDGAINPGQATLAFARRVEESGGSVLFPSTVTGISETAEGMVVATDIESFKVDLVVIAAGIAANEVASMAGLGKTLLKPATPGIIVTTRPRDPLLKTVCYTSDTHFHQQNDGRIVLGEKASAPTTDQHLAYLAERPNGYPNAELARQHASRVIETAAAYVPDLATADIERVGVGWRPLPVDGLPVIGQPEGMPGVYLAAMHSGVTLAPIIGHLAAMEILDGVRVDLLADFRYERL